MLEYIIGKRNNMAMDIEEEIYTELLKQELGLDDYELEKEINI